MQFKARYRVDSNTDYQLLATHLRETAMYAELFAQKIGLSKPAILMALSHDLGKGCKSWAGYLEASHRKGRVSKKDDHGTAGGQYLYDAIVQRHGSKLELVAQLIATCSMYHHGTGLPDIIKPDGTAQLLERLAKSKEETHVDEAAANLDTAIKLEFDALLSDEDFAAETMGMLRNLTISKTAKARYFYLGLTARFLSSCLIDGDRRSSALFDKGIAIKREEAIAVADWKGLRLRLENHLEKLSADGKLNKIRRMVSSRCEEFAKSESGLYTLTAATGAGKTLASLRYALTHAELAGKERIFIIAPYTSILDQNADEIRRILDPDGKNGQIVLEHHSNLEEGDKIEYFFNSSQTWNVPIIITTMVQFLEVLFGYGTRKIRRMHQLANSVIIFDEVQTLPISCTYLFTWALQYLCQSAKASVILMICDESRSSIKPKT